MIRRVEARRFHRDEAGVTLTELIVAISILGIVGVVLAGAFIVSARTNQATTTRFKESHDTQIATAYLANDVQSATAITSAGCGGSGIVNFQYSDNTIASYIAATADGESRLSRKYCDSGGTVVNDATLVHLAGSTPTATCKGTSGWGACNPAADDHPNKVKIAVSEGTGYSFSLSGSRRIRAGSGPVTVGDYPKLLVLSGGSLTTSGNGTVDVNGNVILNPGATASHNHFSYDSIEVVGASCTGWTSCSVRQQEVLDPFQYLPLPVASGRPIFTDGDPSHGPGVYRGQPLTFGHGTTTLASGEYIVEAGFSLVSDSVIDGTAGVLMYNGCAADSTGCSNTGQLTINGNDQRLLLEPYHAGMYANTDIVLWQPPLNVQPLTIAGQGQASALHGVIYAPTANPIVLATGNSSASQIGWVIGKYISVAGSPGSDVTIG